MTRIIKKTSRKDAMRPTLCVCVYVRERERFAGCGEELICFSESGVSGNAHLRTSFCRRPKGWSKNELS